MVAQSAALCATLSSSPLSCAHCEPGGRGGSPHRAAERPAGEGAGAPDPLAVSAAGLAAPPGPFSWALLAAGFLAHQLAAPAAALATLARPEIEWAGVGYSRGRGRVASVQRPKPRVASGA